LSGERVLRLKDVLSGHPGLSPVFLHVGDKCIRLGPQFWVDRSGGLAAELRELLGANCLSFG